MSVKVITSDEEDLDTRNIKR